MVIAINKANYIGNYKITFEFSDGTQRTVDFQPFLLENRNPVTRKYLDIEKFKDFKLDHGDIMWNDYELCFPIWDLYTGKI